jgi:DNA sulfur modification protein DndD
LKILEQRDITLLDIISRHVGGQGIDEIKQVMASERKQHENAAQVEAYLDLSEATLPQLSHLCEKLPIVRSSYAELVARQQEVSERILALEQKLGSVPSTDSIKQIREKCDYYEGLINEATIKLADAGAEWEFSRRRVDSLNSSLINRMNANLQSGLEVEDDRRLLDYAEADRQVLVQLKIEVAKFHLGDIEVKIADCLKKLLRKTKLVTRVAICPDDYSIQLFDKKDRLIHPDRLSAGERQLLAISILWGLAQAADSPMPVVIDTPLGRLDGQHRDHLITRYFPNAGQQVILLSTDQEIDEEAYDKLKPYLAHEYTLDYDEETQATTVRAGYAFA